MQPKTNRNIDGRILFVDDDKNILRSLSRLCNPHGFQIYTANSAQLALKLLKNTPIDIIVADMRMPGMDGADLLAKAKSLYPSIARILLTGHEDFNDTVKAVNHGHIDEYLNKPWDNGKLLDILYRYTGEKKEKEKESNKLKVQNQKLIESALEKSMFNRRINHELDKGRVLQRHLMPESLPSHLPITGINLAADKLSGDFFDYFIRADGKLCFCLGDVCGKGVNASLLMSKTVSVFRSLSKDIEGISDLLQRLNTELLDPFIPGMFVTMGAGIFDLENNLIDFSNAGHVPALKINRDGSDELFYSDAIPLGIEHNVKYESVVIDMNNSSFYLYSDGIIEASIEPGRQLEIDGLCDLLRHHSSSPFSDRLGKVIDSITKNEKSIQDDMTILLLESNLKTQ